MRKFSSLLLIKRSFYIAARSVMKEASYECTIPRMSGWQIHSYGGLEELQFSSHVKKPIIRSPTELLVRVEASSVNPIDVAMIGGYGSTFLNSLRRNNSNIEFPLILGRDFVGTVVQKGLTASEIKVGDKIWGVVPVHSQGGCHSEFVTVDSCYVSKKPENISDVEAAAILYAGLTAYSGIFITARLNGLSGIFTDSIQRYGKDKKILVLGGSGGVGHLAIQILVAEGAEVLTTCSKDAIPQMERLGVSKAIDYSVVESDRILVSESPFDFILDCASKGPEYAKALPWKFTDYVTFTTPMLRNFDQNGMLLGGLYNLKNIVTQNVKGTCSKGVVKWAFIVPSKKGILYLKKLVEDGKLIPMIDSKFPYHQLSKAYEKVSNGRLRGKVVVEH